MDSYSENEDAVVVAVEAPTPKKNKKSKKSKGKGKSRDEIAALKERYTSLKESLILEQEDGRKCSSSSGDAVVLESYTTETKETRKDKHKEKRKNDKRGKGDDYNRDAEIVHERSFREDEQTTKKDSKRQKDVHDLQNGDEEEERESRKKKKKQKRIKEDHDREESDDKKKDKKSEKYERGRYDERHDSSHRRQRKAAIIDDRSKVSRGDRSEEKDRNKYDRDHGKYDDEAARDEGKSKRRSKKNINDEGSESETQKLDFKGEKKSRRERGYVTHDEYRYSHVTDDRKITEGYKASDFMRQSGEDSTTQRGILKSNSPRDGSAAESREQNLTSNENRRWESTADGHFGENRNEVKFSVVEDAAKVSQRRRSRKSEKDEDSESSVNAWSSTDHLEKESKSKHAQNRPPRKRSGSESGSGSSSYSSGTDSGSDSESESGSYSDSYSDSEYSDGSESYTSGSSYTESFTDGSYSGSDFSYSDSDISGSQSDYDSDYSTDGRRDFDDISKERMEKETQDGKKKPVSPREERYHDNDERKSRQIDENKNTTKQGRHVEIVEQENDLNKKQELKTTNVDSGQAVMPTNDSKTGSSNKATSRTCAIM